MKIHVICASRNRPKSLLAVLTSLQALQSGKHDIRYTVICDEDDPQTQACGVEAEILCGPRTMVNARHNAVMATSDADVFMPWPDDCFPLSPWWDENINQVVTKAKVPAFSWQEVQDPRNHTIIVLDSKWVRAAGRFFPEYFPFWFADTWLKEVFGFVYGQDMPIVEVLRLSHKRGLTANMHDLEFWFRVFSRTRPERIEEAKRVCQAYGIAWFEKPQLLDGLERIDAMQLERVPKYEEVFGANVGEKNEMYLAAKARAEKLFTVEHAFEEAA